MNFEDPKEFHESYLRNSHEGNMFGLTKLAEAVAKTGLRGYAVLDMSLDMGRQADDSIFFPYCFFIYRASIPPEEIPSRYLYRIANCFQDLLPWLEGNARSRCKVTQEHTVQTQRANGTCGTQHRRKQRVTECGV